jgi:hypothetical protein
MPVAFREEYIFVCWWPDVEMVASRIDGEQKIVCRVADMVTWSPQAPADWQRRFGQVRPKVFAFIASSNEIGTELNAMGVKNVAVIGDPVDPKQFTPRNRTPTDKIRLGWCGNPVALEWLGFVDLKGVSLLNELRSHTDIEILMACGLPRSEMPRWYDEIDIYVCTSKAEGTPLPLLEAMASGKIVITTSVGIVPEITSPGVFVFDGTFHGLSGQLKQVVQRRKDWSWLGLENRNYVMAHRTAPVMARKLRKFLWDLDA